jgi:hypothetical protein
MVQENFAYQEKNIVLHRAEPQLLVVSYQLSVLEVILKFEDLEVWKRSSRLCAD